MDLADELTYREQQVWSRMALGMTNEQIALQLKLSKHTVCFYAKRLLYKLGVDTRAKATLLFCRKLVAEGRELPEPFSGRHAVPVPDSRLQPVAEGEETCP